MTFYTYPESTPTERKLAIWVGDETGVPRQAGGGLDEEELTAFLTDFLPLAPSVGDGSVAFGPNERQRGTASGTGAVSLGRQNSVEANYSMAIGKRCKTHATGPYALAIGDDAQTRRHAEFAHGLAPGNNLLIFQRSWLQNGGVTRGAQAQNIRTQRETGHGEPFDLYPGQMYSVAARVNAMNAAGDTAEYELRYTAKRRHDGSAPEIVGDMSTHVLHADVDAWSVEPRVVGSGSGPIVDLFGAAREGEDVLWDAHIDWHETTLPGPAPSVPVVTQFTPGDRQVTFAFDVPNQQPEFESHMHQLVLYRGTSPGDITFEAKYSHPEEIDELVEEGTSRSSHPAPENGTGYYYQFAYSTLHGLESAKTDVIGPVTPTAG